MKNIQTSRKKTMSLSRVYGRLFEQEEKENEGGDEGGDEGSAEEDLFGTDEGGDEGGDEDGDEGGDEDGDETDTGDEEDKKDDEKPEEDSDDEKEKLKISAEDKARLEDSIDAELEGIMTDFETDARKSAQMQAEKMKTESLKKVYKRLLYEVAADDIDLKSFAGNIARLVKNYDTLLDIESIILNKAYVYIQNNYGEDTVKALKDVLEQDHDIAVERTAIEKDEPEVPIAVGAMGGQSGGGA